MTSPCNNKMQMHIFLPSCQMNINVFAVRVTHDIKYLTIF